MHVVRSADNSCPSCDQARARNRPAPNAFHFEVCIHFNPAALLRAGDEVQRRVRRDACGLEQRRTCDPLAVAQLVAFYDSRTGILFSGDFLMPCRLLIDDAAAYHDSALRVIDFLKTRPLTHILGGHIELNRAGQAYRFGSHYHPNEHRLELAREDLTALPAAFESFNGLYGRHPNYILTNPIHNLLALVIIAVAVLIFIVWGVRRLLRRRRSG